MIAIFTLADSKFALSRVCHYLELKKRQYQTDEKVGPHSDYDFRILQTQRIKITMLTPLQLYFPFQGFNVMDKFWEKKYGKIYGQVLLIVTINQN